MKNVSVIKTSSENVNVLERLVEQGVVSIDSSLRHVLSEMVPVAQAQPEGVRWFHNEDIRWFHNEDISGFNN